MSQIGNVYKQLLKPWGLRLLWTIVLMSVCRSIFYFSNAADFTAITLKDWIIGIWFDAITLGLLCLPLITFAFLPLPIQSSKGYQVFLRVVYLLCNAFLLIFNLIDVEYFSFTKKRSTVDVFEMIQGGNDLTQQIGSYFRDFWLVMILFVGCMWLTNKVYKKTQSTIDRGDYGLKSILFVLVIGLFIFVGRGGFVLKPLSPIDASQFTRVENAAFVLNTPFTLVKSVNKQGLEEKHYFSEKVEKLLFNPIRQSVPQMILPKKTNVVVLILESFGNEWVGASGVKKSFTPFFDSLTKESLYFQHGIANGKKSIEAVPAIFASIPSLLDNPYISSMYGNNRVEALPQLLKKEGYTSAFFHGATNGSMKFDGFAAQAGFEHYFGRTEYNNEKHYDQSWGILDEYFNPWTAKQLTTLKQPFLASLFTLSSHHPYYIPPHMRGKLRKGPEPICEALHYGDYSLKKFFEEAKKQPWYENTLFILCADHTAASNNPVYNQRGQMYQIPIVFFHPKGLIKPKKETRILQQIDILPTTLDLLGIKTNYYSYGNSYFQNTKNEAINYLEGTYNYFNNKHVLTFSKEKARNLYSIETRNKTSVDSIRYYKKEAALMEKRLKAILQRYNRDLIRNQTTVYEKKSTIHH